LDLDFAIIDQERAAVGLVIPEQTFHQGRLASTVFTEEGMHRPLGDPQRDAVQRREAAEALGDADGFDSNRSHGAGPLRPRR